MSEFTVSHSFDAYNNLIMNINYYDLHFTFIYNESYLKTPEQWDEILATIASSEKLVFTEIFQSWQNVHIAIFPKKYRQPYIDAVNQARLDPRINTYPHISL